MHSHRLQLECLRCRKKRVINTTRRKIIEKSDTILSYCGTCHARRRQLVLKVLNEQYIGRETIIIYL
jgi:transcription elongation factor Elf1